MTNLDDFDRSLADFLADGPNTAPEAPVIAAMAHARTTPRRPDLLRAFRADPMAPRRSGLAAGRLGLVLAVLAVAVASAGVAIVGSRQPDDSILPIPSATPSGTVPAPFQASIPLTVAAGNPFTLTVIDPTGVVIGVESGRPGDGASVSDVAIATDPGDDHVLVVTWTGMPCESRATMTIDGRQRTISILSERCSGDTIALDRVARLRLSTAVLPEEWTATNGFGPEATDPRPGPQASATTAGPFQPIGSPAVTPVRVVLVDESGNQVAVDVVDESGLLASAVAGPSAGGQSVDVFDATNDAPAVVRLTWPGKPCDTVLRLTIDAALANLTLDAPQCHGDAMGVDRTMILTFLDPVDAPSLSTAFHAGRGGVDMPTWTTIAPDAGAGTYRVRLSDPGYLVDSLDGFFDPERGSTGVGEAGYTIDQVDASTLRLVWLGPSCATEFDLVLDATGNTWVLWSAPCETSRAVLRMFDLSLARPLVASTIKFEARVGEPGG